MDHFGAWGPSHDLEMAHLAVCKAKMGYFGISLSIQDVIVSSAEIAYFKGEMGHLKGEMAYSEMKNGLFG